MGGRAAAMGALPRKPTKVASAYSDILNSRSALIRSVSAAAAQMNGNEFSRISHGFTLQPTL